MRKFNTLSDSEKREVYNKIKAIEETLTGLNDSIDFDCGNMLSQDTFDKAITSLWNFKDELNVLTFKK